VRAAPPGEPYPGDPAEDPKTFQIDALVAITVLSTGLFTKLLMTVDFFSRRRSEVGSRE
jgi:hypothetical protein